MSKKADKKTKKFVFNGYVNIAISESDVPKLEEYLADVKVLYEDMHTAAVDGYSLKVYYNDDEGNFRASLTCMNAEDDNFGHLLSAFADDWMSAIGVLLFKHFVVAKNDWNKYKQKSTRSFG